MSQETKRTGLERGGQRRARRVAAILVALLGLVLLWDRLGLLYYGLASENWPIVAGEVVAVEHQTLGGGRTNHSYRLLIEYRYEVDGNTYSGSRQQFTRSPLQYADHEDEDLASLYQVGQVLAVLHHPERPQLAVLASGADRSVWLGLILGGILVLVAVLFWTIPTRTISPATKH